MSARHARWPWRLAIGAGSAVLGLGFLGWILALPVREAEANPIPPLLPTPVPTVIATPPAVLTPGTTASPTPASGTAPQATATPQSAIGQPGAVPTVRPRNTRTRAS